MPHKVLASAAREVYSVLEARTATHRRLRDHLTAVVLATLGVDMVCALAGSCSSGTRPKPTPRRGEEIDNESHR